MTRKLPNPIDVHVGGRVRMRRMLIGMSQEKLGESLGLTFQQVQKYEKGSNRIGASRLYQIGSVLGVPIEYFFEGVEPGEGNGMEPDAAPSPGFDMDILSTAEGIQLNSAFFAIADPKLRKRILDLVKALGGLSDEVETPATDENQPH
ncbi:transcriptional regulator, XRE family [Parvibaculum lavamentivorans DS-1]|uniref:Transcriptional regulator, XRE family n=2 Tax=Parvibaculum lavamentivorans TaxID=256618 RepID=A7HZ87_PARL1|nr:transcriptional regulator, XRE family [Parvibaculum lavamentivorans DS-1]